MSTSPQQPKKNKYERDQAHKKKLERLADTTDVAGRRDKQREYTDDKEKTAYVERWYRDKRSSALKKIAARKARRYEGDIPNGCGYRRLFDFWWEF